MNSTSEWRLPSAANRIAGFFVVLLADLLAVTLAAQTPLRLGELDADNFPTVIDLQGLTNDLNGFSSFGPQLDLTRDLRGG